MNNIKVIDCEEIQVNGQSYFQPENDIYSQNNNKSEWQHNMSILAGL